MLPSPMRALGRGEGDQTPDALHLAVITGRIKRIKRLIRKGVHIESVNSLGQTPLFSAAFGGDFEVVEILLRLGANPNRHCGAAGASPVHAASYRGSRRVLRALVEAGGDLSIRDSQYLTPRDYALKQPSPIRRQKIIEFFDLLSAMTLHQMASSSSTLPSNAGILPERGSTGSATLRSQKLRRSFFGGSQISLSRKSSHQSTSSVWSSCVSDASSVSADDLDVPRPRSEIVVTPNLHQNVSCHLLDQLCVTTSLPLLSPGQLKRPASPSPAYTCGGPTVYSSFSWMGTPVTVRRPTPALSMTRKGIFNQVDVDSSSPDQDAVKSLLQELAFLRRLRHPGFLEVMAACHVTHPSPDHVTLVYQHVPHGSLYHHLHVQHHDLSVGGAVDLLIGLVEALLFIHAHGFFHAALSSHALHLVDLRTAKLGGFEYAFETQVKGVGMRAEHLSRANWLMAWQAPETVLEKMVSTRTEVYALSAIIWEIWSGMPPWSGVEEEEMKKRLAKGEVLPPLKGTTLSLVSYLTEYGLKWEPHERELDLHEIHTMLRSLRIQCNEEERVPAVSLWGPPSVPNTPIIGRGLRSVSSSHLDSSAVSSVSSSSGELRPRRELLNGEAKQATSQVSGNSSSCTLASGSSVPSAGETNPVPPAKPARSGNSQDSMSKFDTKPPSSRPLSLFSDKGAVLSSATLPASSKLPSRRSSEGTRPRSRRIRRRHDIEFEEAFIDDEFDANLLAQPHMQLSVSSAENLLERRSSLQFSDDSGSSSNLSQGGVSRDLEDEEGRKTPEGKCSSEEATPECQEGSSSKRVASLISKSDPSDSSDPGECSKEVKAKMKALTLDKNFSYYLPKHAFVSDSEDVSE